LSLYRTGALRNLVDMLNTYEIDILAIQEMRWIGQNILERKDCTVYYSCHDKTHHFGTGFIVSKKIRDMVMDFQPISMRICKLRLRGKFCNYSIVCAHAPTEEKSYHEKDIFYELLERAQDSCPVRDVKIVIGDFNAKIGHDDNARPFISKESVKI
jgi:exonuclease III